jgi:hypothetical protein
MMSCLAMICRRIKSVTAAPKVGLKQYLSYICLSVTSSTLTSNPASVNSFSPLFLLFMSFYIPLALARFPSNPFLHSVFPLWFSSL